MAWVGGWVGVWCVWWAGWVNAQEEEELCFNSGLILWLERPHKAASRATTKGLLPLVSPLGFSPWVEASESRGEGGTTHTQHTWVGQGWGKGWGSDWNKRVTGPFSTLCTRGLPALLYRTFHCEGGLMDETRHGGRSF